MERIIFLYKLLIFQKVSVRWVSHLKLSIGKTNISRKWTAKTQSWAKSLIPSAETQIKWHKRWRIRENRTKPKIVNGLQRNTMVGADNWILHVTSKSVSSLGRPAKVSIVSGWLESGASGFSAHECFGGELWRWSLAVWPWASSSLVQTSGISFVSSWGGIRSYSRTHFG